MSQPPENRGTRLESSRDQALRPTAPVSAWHRSAARQIRIPPSIYDAPGVGNAALMSIGPLSARNSRDSGTLLSPQRQLPLRSARASDKRPFSNRLEDPPGGSASHIRNSHSIEAAERVGTTSTRAREAARQRLRDSSLYPGHKSSSSEASVRRDASGSDSEHVNSGLKLRNEVFPSRLPLHSDFHSVYGGGFKASGGPRSAVTSPVDIVQTTRLSTSPPIPEHGTVSFAESVPTTAPGASPNEQSRASKGGRGRTAGKAVVPIPLMTPDELDDVMPFASSAVFHSTALRNASPLSPPSRASPTLSPHAHSRSPVALSSHAPPKLDMEGLVVIGSNVSICPEPLHVPTKSELSPSYGEAEAHWMARVAKCRAQLEALRFALPTKSAIPSPTNATSIAPSTSRRGRTGASLRLHLPVRRADSDKSVVSFGGVLDEAVAAFAAAETAMIAAETAQLTCFSSPVITSPPVAVSKPVGPHPPPRHGGDRSRPLIRGRPIRRPQEISSAHPRHHSSSPAGIQALQAAVTACEGAMEKLAALLASVHVSSVTATSAVDSDGGSGIEERLKPPFVPQTPRNQPQSGQGQREAQSSTVNVGPSRQAGSRTPGSVDGGDTDGQVGVSTAPSTPKAKPHPLPQVGASPHSSHRMPPVTPRSSIARIRATYSGVSKSAVTSPVASVSAASPIGLLSPTDPRPSSKGTLQRSSSSHSESRARPQHAAVSPVISAVITMESLKQRAVTWLTRLSNAQSVLESVITSATMSDAVKVGESGHDLRTVLVRAVTSLQETVESAIAQLNSEDTQLIVLEGGVMSTPGHSPVPITGSGRSTPHTTFDASLAGGSPQHPTQTFALHRPPTIVVDASNLREGASDVEMPGGSTLPLEAILQANEMTVSSIEQQCMSLQRMADLHTTVTLCKQQVEVTQAAIAQAELAQTKAVSEFGGSRTMDSQTMTGASQSVAQSASLRSLSSTVTHAHAQSGLLVQLSPYWARLAAIRARSCDLVAQLGPLCGVHVPLDVTLQKAPESPSEPIALVVSADVDIAEDSLAYEALDNTIPRILRSIRSALTAAAQCEFALLAILNDKSVVAQSDGEGGDDTFTARAVDAALRFSKEVDSAEAAVDVLSAFVDAWPAMYDASERIQHLRRRVNAGHLASLSEATASSAKHSLTTAKMAVANAEKSFVSLLRSLSSGKRHGSGSGAFVRGLRALFSAQARTNPVSPQRFASSISSGGGNATMAALLVPKQSPALQSLMVNVKKAESIVSQALNSGVRSTHRRKDDEAALLAKLQEYTHRLVGVIVCFKGLGIASWPRLLALPLKSKFQACFEAIRVANEAWQSDDGTSTSGTPNTSKSSGRSSFMARRQIVNMAGMELRVLERGVVEAKASLVHSKRTRPQLDRRMSLAHAASTPVAADVTTDDILPSPKLAGKWFTDLFTAVTALDNDMSGFVSTVGHDDASLPRFPSFVGEEVAALSASMSLERQRTWSEGSLATVAMFARETRSTNVSGQNGGDKLMGSPLPQASPLLAGQQSDDQSHALPFTSSEHFSSSNGTATVSGGSNSGISAGLTSDVQGSSVQQHQPIAVPTPTPPVPQAVVPARRFGRRFAIDLTAALKRSSSMDESRLHAWQAVMSPKASPHDVLSPTGGDGKPLKRRGSGRHYRTRPGSVVSLQSTTPYGKGNVPLDSGFDTESSASDGEGGGQTRSYGSRTTLSVVSGSTITSRQRRRYTSRSHRTSDGSSVRDRGAVARPRNPDGRSSDSDSDFGGSRRQHRHRSASQRQRHRGSNDDTRSVRDSRHHAFFP